MKGKVLYIFVLAVVVAVGLKLILGFAFSDFMDLYRGDSSIMESKPWRPMSRVIFGGVVVPIYLAFIGWFCTALFRDRSPGRKRQWARKGSIAR